MNVFELPAVDELVRAALVEDVGRGDLTTQLTVSAEVRGKGEIVAKQEGVLAGMPLVEKVYRHVTAGGVRVDRRLGDGASFASGTMLAALAGPAAGLLTGERVALNFLQHLSGIATLTHRYMAALAGTRARLVDTRKTTPGLRLLEKYAVRMGGGHNHRMGLDDGILIKDNHIAAAGGVTIAVERARAAAPHSVKIEVECTTLEQVQEAVRAGADTILLDNMSVDAMATAAGFVKGRALLEASGGITLENIRAVAEAGVDLISVGALTHSAPAVDLSMSITLAP